MPVGRLRAQGPRGGLSRNKVAVGESAAGSPPKGAFQPSPAGLIYWQAHGLVAQRESAAFARRRPRVQIPPSPLNMHPAMKVVGEGLMGSFAQVRPCRGSSPNAIWDRLYRRVSQPVDGSARAPTKGVPSCEKPGGGARSLRTRDSRMGYPVPSGTLRMERERGERKHLSTRRKRKQTRCRE